MVYGFRLNIIRWSLLVASLKLESSAVSNFVYIIRPYQAYTRSYARVGVDEHEIKFKGLTGLSKKRGKAIRKGKGNNVGGGTGAVMQRESRSMDNDRVVKKESFKTQNATATKRPADWLTDGLTDTATYATQRLILWAQDWKKSFTYAHAKIGNEGQ